MGNFTEIKLLLCVLIALTCIKNGSCSQISLKQNEQQAIKKLKALVMPSIPDWSFVHKFAKDDLYFLRWLQVSSMNVKEAEKKILNHLNWRKTENIDTIESEDWTKSLQEFPTYTDKHDKQGRPIAEIWLSDWDVRKAVKARQTFYRWSVKWLESVHREIYEQRSKGKNISGAIVIGDLEKFTVFKQACPLCIPEYIKFVITMESQYPRLFDEIYCLSTPPEFDVLLQVLKPMFRTSTINSLKSILTKEEWLIVLDNMIDKSQRARRFGGTIVRPNESTENN